MEQFGTREGATFVNIWTEYFVIRSRHDDPLAKRRENKNGKEIWERRGNFLRGKITRVKINTEGTYGHELLITLSAEEDYVLSMMATSGTAFSFYRRAENIDYNEEVVFDLWKFDNPGNTKHPFSYVLGIKQFGEIVQSKYEKEDIPRWEKREDGKYDRSKAYHFFDDKIKKLPVYVEGQLYGMLTTDEKRMKGVGGKSGVGVPITNEDIDYYQNEDDDLPF